MSDGYYRGSEWNKWDLHIHSPASYHWNGGKKLKEMTAEEKEAEIKKFIKTVNESDVEVFAVQDYWSFDWILELRQYVRAHPEELQKTVLPGMELRAECSADYRLNIHAILSNDVTDQQLRDFQAALQIRKTGKETQNISDEALIDFAKRLDKSKAKYHGFDDPSKLTEDQLLELGSKTVEVTRESLSAAIEKVPQGKAFIMLPYSTSDGLLKLDWREHPMDDIYYMQTADVFETRDQRNIDLFGGIQTEANKDYYKNFLKTLGNKPKPCISGSDGHRFADYGAFPNNKATWIKADPTFLGFEQIIYEPTSRAKVQQLEPDEKSPQLIIDRVEFKNPDGSQEVIPLNQNLNSIIGSRAQGKSNLLKNIAYCIDPEQTKLRNIDTSDFITLDDFTVYWKDGSKNTSDPNEDKDKGLLFIPQKFLGELLYGKNPQFDSFVTSLFENREDFKASLEAYRKLADQNLVAITAIIREVLDARSEGSSMAVRLRKLGNRDSFIKETGELDARIKVLGAEAEISESDLKTYDELSEQHQKLSRAMDSQNRDIGSLKNLINFDVINADRIEAYDFSEATYNRILKELRKDDANFKGQFVSDEITRINELIAINRRAILVVEKDLKPLQAKIKKHAALISLTKRQAQLKETIALIEKTSEELNTLRKYYGSKKEELIKAYAEYEKGYASLDVSLPELQFSDIKLVITFNKQGFLRWAENGINYHNSTEFRRDELNRYINANKFLEDPQSWHYDAKTYPTLLKELLDGILSGKLILKSGQDIESIISELLKNRHGVNFLKSVRNKDGVTFDDMSDGEQMLSLLEMIFKFDDYNYPVLLDQPEDDLDSRAISTTVVDFLCSEKQNRQILVASHNANIVVCGDSENILVSSKKAGAPPSFYYANGAIEQPKINKEILEILEGGVDAFELRRKKIGRKS